MIGDTSQYNVHRLGGLSAGIWGESYVILTAFEAPPDEVATEFFVLTTRPTEALHWGSSWIQTIPIPEHLGLIDLEFAKSEGRTQVEVLVSEMLEARADELGRPDVAYRPFQLGAAESGSLLGCWMRGKFKAQLKEISTLTKCGRLQRYLNLLPSVSIMIRPA